MNPTIHIHIHLNTSAEALEFLRELNAQTIVLPQTAPAQLSAIIESDRAGDEDDGFKTERERYTSYKRAMRKSGLNCMSFTDWAHVEDEVKTLKDSTDPIEIRKLHEYEDALGMTSRPSDRQDFRPKWAPDPNSFHYGDEVLGRIDGYEWKEYRRRTDGVTYLGHADFRSKISRLRVLASGEGKSENRRAEIMKLCELLHIDTDGLDE